MFFLSIYHCIVVYIIYEDFSETLSTGVLKQIDLKYKLTLYMQFSRELYNHSKMNELHVLYDKEDRGKAY